ncbi:MAG: 2-polyprenyl-6-methoxyphenol hydroxylase [Cycloclasticus sp. symbiont of Poecilosclerida sp. M]|nr:MAG: 2-polyprenyl-6-methoxyphenol hydroxylase [Cycloclasticus sp. symbiont of Poecilosclerida sp. M]
MPKTNLDTRADKRANKKYQVAIVGGGMVGATVACLLAEKGISVALIDAADPTKQWKESSYDLRVSALTLASIKTFQSLGVWSDMQALGAQPFHKMFVWDHFGSGELDIDSADAGEMQMGFVVENRVTVLALWDKLKALESCDLYKESLLESFNVEGEVVDIQFTNKTQIKAELLVAADGSNSKIRQLSGVDDYGWDYQQKALVATVKPELLDQNTAWQRFLPEGPLALLPLRDGLISIVWTANTKTTEARLKLPDEAFCNALAEASEQQLGSFELIGGRGAFPLKMQFSTSYSQERVVLIGDAIHTIHPLAGQGANLGLKDALNLAEVLLHAYGKGRDISSQQVLRRYERQRKADNLMMMGVMDGIKRLFGADELAVQLARSSGMGFINRSTIVKNQICKYAMGL